MICSTKTALAHDWLNGMRGGEKCLEVFCDLFPESPVYTLFYEPGKVSENIASHPIRTSFLQRFPGIFSRYRNYLPFFPAAVRSLDAGDCDLIVSTSHCVAKGIRKKAGALHICYCFTPMRYAWLFFDEYFGKKGFLSRLFIRAIIQYLRAWDLGANRDVDRFIAISHHVRKRVETFYGRPAQVIYPPVDTDFYRPDSSVPREDFYLVVSALVPYKNVELTVRTFVKNGKKLVIVGDGPEKNALQKMAGPNIEFAGWQPDEKLREYYRRARALLFPGEEDFGIVPVEMQACGGPVIALARGGALETVVEPQSGLFFSEATVDDLTNVIERFESCSFDPQAARQNAKLFSKDRFYRETHQMIEESLMEKK